MHCSKKKNRPSNCARRVRSRPLPLKSMINGWVLRELTEITAAGNLKEPRGEPFCCRFLIPVQRYPQGSSKKSISSCALNLPVDGSKGSRRPTLRSHFENSEWIRHKSFWMYQFLYRGSISDITSLVLGSWRGEWHWNWVIFFHFMYCSSINMEIVKLRTIKKITFETSAKTCFFSYHTNVCKKWIGL